MRDPHPESMNVPRAALTALDLTDPRVTGGHAGHRPSWVCETCADPWPCAPFRAYADWRLPRAALIPTMSVLLRSAIPDLRGRPQGPTPPEIVRRFLWFLPLTDDEARAVALRLR
ncbi:hypothetical protein AB0C02_27830 [Micromonospora sp. NPDC048999]|uniref:hypothetical protein n=1 Tax=Micromonospora sp. NPDC048999 TaxID=3155391 RepID=UPI003411CD20